MTARDRPADANDAARFTVGLAGALFAIGAIALEAVSGTFANSPIPAWGELVPLAWPPPLRVAWWAAAAAGAAAFRWSLIAVGRRPHVLVTTVSVAPFVVFAGGIAFGAEWSTWH